MAYAYGTKGAPAIGGGAPGLPRLTAARGEMVFPLPGTYTVTVPENVYSLCALAIGGGGGSYANASYEISSGAGGGVAWKNDIPVSPGQEIAIQVGAGRNGQIGSSAQAGDTSYVIDTTVCAATGGAGGAQGVAAQGGTMLAGDGGGAGGNGAFSTATDATVKAASGGAAGGYTGNGANGVVASVNLGAKVGNAGAGGGGGSGGASAASVAGGSGGVGIYGEGASGTGGGSSGGSGGGGSGGQNGLSATEVGVAGIFGAGGSAVAGSASGNAKVRPGACGCVRIIWGDGRAFPSTDVGPS